MLGRERRDRIRQQLATDGSVRIATLSRELGVSESTVRRDLTELARLGLAERVHGGAVRRTGDERPSVERAQRQAAEKARIAVAAVRLVKPDTTILLSGGTTTAAMIPHLTTVPGLTVITNSLDIAWQISRHESLDLIVIGGWLRHGEGSLLGRAAEAMRDLSPDTAFFGCFGISGTQGVTGASMAEVDTDRTMIAATSELVVLADHTKFAQRGPVVLTPTKDVSTVVTDRLPPAADLAALEAEGVEVIVAGAGPAVRADRRSRQESRT